MHVFLDRDRADYSRNIDWIKKLFPYCFLHFEYDIRRQYLHFVCSFCMINKFSHKFMIGRSVRFKRAIHSDIFTGNWWQEHSLLWLWFRSDSILIHALQRCMAPKDDVIFSLHEKPDRAYFGTLIHKQDIPNDSFLIPGKYHEQSFPDSSRYGSIFFL